MRAKLLAFQLVEQCVIPICLLVLLDHIWYSIYHVPLKNCKIMGFFWSKLFTLSKEFTSVKDCVVKNKYVYQHYGLLFCACVWYVLK